MRGVRKNFYRRGDFVMLKKNVIAIFRKFFVTIFKLAVLRRNFFVTFFRNFFVTIFSTILPLTTPPPWSILVLSGTCGLVIRPFFSTGCLTPTHPPVPLDTSHLIHHSNNHGCPHRLTEDQ